MHHQCSIREPRAVLPIFPHDAVSAVSGRESPAWLAMSDSRPASLRRGLAFAAAVEFATGLALCFDPALVVRLLLGLELAGAGVLLARCFGIALLSLALACWPAGPRGSSAAAAVRGMLVYNISIALFLGWLGVTAQPGGLLLWPAAALHAGVAVWIGRTGLGRSSHA